jgi:hypothetical protein
MTGFYVIKALNFMGNRASIGYARPGQPHSHRTGRAAHSARRFVQKGFPMTTATPAEPQLTDARAAKFGAFVTHPRATAAAELANEKPQRIHHASALAPATREA